MAENYLSPEDQIRILERRLREGQGGSELSGFEKSAQFGPEVQDIEDIRDAKISATMLSNREAGYDQAAYDEQQDSMDDQFDFAPDEWDKLWDIEGKKPNPDQWTQDEENRVVGMVGLSADEIKREIKNGHSISDILERGVTEDGHIGPPLTEEEIKNSQRWNEGDDIRPHSQVQPKASRSPASVAQGEVADIEGPAAMQTQEVADIEDVPQASGMATPQIAKDIEGSGVNSTEVYRELTKKFHGALAVIEPLTVPSHYLADATMRMVNADHKTKWKQAELVPWLKYPDTTFTDIAVYAGDTIAGNDQKILEQEIANGGTASDAAKKVGMKAAAVYTAGAMADWFLDPMNYIGVGGASKAEQAALRAGEDAGRSGSLLSIRSPIKGENLAELTRQDVSKVVRPVKELAGKVGDAVFDKMPIGAQDAIRSANNARIEAVNFAKRFVPETGDLEIDAMKRMTLNTNQMIPEMASRQYLDTRFKRGITQAEDAVTTIAAEKTPNLMPSLKGLEGRELSQGELAVLGKSEAELRPLVVKQIEEINAAQKMNLPPQRIEAIADDVMDVKKMNGVALQAQESAGKIDFARPLDEQLIENYVAHVPDIRVARAMSKSSKLSVEQALEWTEAQARREIEGMRIMTNPDKKFGHRREMSRGLTISEANERMFKNPEYQDILKRAGTNQFFTESAFTSSFMNMTSKLKAANSKPMIEMLDRKGFKWNPIKRSFDLDPKVYPLAGRLSPAEGFARRRWAEDTASKLNYAMTRTETNVSKAIDVYNRIFRTTALAKPGYYLQNWGDALYKNITQYVVPGDYVDAMKAWSGKGGIVLDGRIQPATRLMNELETFGVIKGSHTAEALYSSMAMGKRLTAEGAPIAKQGKFKTLVGGVEKFGASGENWSRAALYINRRKQGYSPKQALYDVENIHFNYGETTKQLDTVRKFFPFFQFPVKSLRIAKDLTLARPGLSSNFVKWHEIADKALNDPTESAFLDKIQPGYKSIQNGLYVTKADGAFAKYNDFIDNLLGANSWVAKNLLTARYSEEALTALTQYGIKVKAPVGPDAITPWLAWEKAVQESGGPFSGPLADALKILVTGVDPFTNEDYKKGGWDNVLGATMYKLATGPIAVPAFAQVMKQALNPPDAKFFTPPALLWFKGAFSGQSGFAEIDNVDRMYAFKKSRIAAEYKDLTSQFNAINKREVINGNANTSWLSGVPGTTAIEVFRDKLKKAVEIRGVVDTGDYAEWKAEPVNPRTKKPYPVPDLAQVYADMKGLLQANKELDANYIQMKEAAVKSRREERDGMADQMRMKDQDPEPEETQEVSDEEFDSPVDVPGDDEQDDQAEETD